MTYSLEFHVLALKEWNALGAAIKTQFKTKLAERLENPRVPKDRLHGAKDRYKIKLRQAGFRLVYEVTDNRLIVSVIAVGKRDKSMVYAKAAKR
ncbi:MAG: type II toxin-antitoxin system RelE family toxin [Planktomarina sp.]